MRNIHQKTRWLVITSLTFSLALAGLFPQLTVLADTVARASNSLSPTSCCCGTQDGRCCGMGCCLLRQTPANERPPSPNPQDSQNGQNNLLAVTLAKALFGTSGESAGGGNHRPENERIRWLPPFSLQAQHVRIDA